MISNGIPLARSTGGGRVLAVLGPTNTGKTHFAMERMLAHSSGMIGFPLRLLARENYDRIVRMKGAASVALVTGEERIIPPGARWFVCTVEAMPVERPVACLAVDEIQLAADPERGHTYTDRLLHARGLDESLFLGAETVKSLLRRLVPGAEYLTRPRMSQLTYTGYHKVARLPPRSVIVAFSAQDVYQLAEQIRRQRGGTAVILGALSPRTRNAQVALYQAGEVDYLVATDAIGMGLNMDIDHVAFARLKKFDGRSPRLLRAHEVAQIAGRAGRHMADGTFGTTDTLGELEPDIIRAVETHSFDPVTALSWRNPNLDYRTPDALLRSLDQRPPAPELVRVREADDQLTLTRLLQDPAVARLATEPAAVRLLWDVCQIPDFTKTLSDAHTRQAGEIYAQLISHQHLPVDWVASRISRLERVDGDIDTLISRLAHIRTWTYVSFRPGWLADPKTWQERARDIEDRLSDALHQRLTQRFIDRRAMVLSRSLTDGPPLAAIGPDGEVLLDGMLAGRLDGFSFLPDASLQPGDRQSALTVARRCLREEIQRRVRQFDAVGDADITIHPDGSLRWQDAIIARLTPGTSPLTPAISVLQDDFIDPAQRSCLHRRLERRVAAEITNILAPLLKLTSIPTISGSARGLIFQLREALGVLPRHIGRPMLDALTPADLACLARHGVETRASFIHLPALLKPRPAALKALLWSVWKGMPLPPPLPPSGHVSLTPDPSLSPDYYLILGFAVTGGRAIRIDIRERFERRLHGVFKAGPLTVQPQLAAMIGSSVAQLPAVMEALGWKPTRDVDGETIRWVRKKQPRRHPAARPDTTEGAFASLKILEGHT